MLTEQEIKTFLSIKGISNEGHIRGTSDKPQDFRYGCDGVYNGDVFRLKMSRALRLLDDEIFSKGDIGLTFSWSSRLGWGHFNLTPEAEDSIRQIVYEHNAEKMLKAAE